MIININPRAGNGIFATFTGNGGGGGKITPRDFIRYLRSGYTDFDAVWCILRRNLSATKRLSHRKWNSFPYLNMAAKPEAPSISRCLNDRHEIPTAIPMFSGSPSPLKSTSTFADVDRHRKYKMAAAKPEVLVSHVV
jgi:hypothetical protein